MVETVRMAPAEASVVLAVSNFNLLPLQDDTVHSKSLHCLYFIQRSGFTSKLSANGWTGQSGI